MNRNLRRIALGATLLLALAAGPTSLFAPPVPASAGPLAPGAVLRDVIYCTPGGLALKMDLYPPLNTPAGPTPVAVYVHGGGWSAGDKADGSGALDIPELRDRGYLVAAVNYRLAPQYP